MAFLDDLGKKISHAGQSTIQKTKGAAEISKINTMISASEKIINNNYYRIGKLYCSVHGSDCEEEFVGMVSAIKQEEQKIDTYRTQILTLKGVVKCQKCGTEVSLNSAFCNVCGASMPKKTPINNDNADKVLCTGCGAYVKKGTRFCTACGQPMPQNLIEQNAVENKEIKRCPNCGFESGDRTNMFCNVCGTKLQAVSDEKAVSPETAAEVFVPTPVAEIPVPIPVIDPIVESPVPAIEETAEEVVAEESPVVGNVEELDEPIAEVVQENIVAETETAADEPTQFTKKCPSCGFETTDEETLFCHICGTRLAADEEQVSDNYEPTLSVKKCPNCSFETTDEETLFCYECGTRLVLSSAQATPVVQNSNQYNDYEKTMYADSLNLNFENRFAQQTKSCPKCGFKTSDDKIMFCYNCGTMLNSGFNNEQIPYFKKCPKCGFETTDDETLFCTECGTRL